MDYVLVHAYVVMKDSKLEYLYETADLHYYVEVLGWTFIGYEDIYI